MKKFLTIPVVLLTLALLFLLAHNNDLFAGADSSEMSEFEFLKKENESLHIEIDKLSRQNSELTSTNKVLEQDIKALREECQQLRKAYVKAEKRAGKNTNKSKDLVETDHSLNNPDVEESNCWLNLSNNKRHNWNCKVTSTNEVKRWRRCKKDEGTPCKNCGG